MFGTQEDGPINCLMIICLFDCVFWNSCNVALDIEWECVPSWDYVSAVIEKRGREKPMKKTPNSLVINIILRYYEWKGAAGIVSGVSLEMVIQPLAVAQHFRYFGRAVDC